MKKRAKKRPRLALVPIQRRGIIGCDSMMERSMRGFPHNKKVRLKVAESLLHVLFPVLTLVLITAGAGTFIGGTARVERYIPIAIGALLLGIDWLLFRRRKTILAAHLFIFFTYITCLTGMILNGGVAAAGYLGLIALMAVAGWLYSVREALLFWLLTMFTAAIFLYLGKLEFLREAPPLSPVMICIYVVGFQALVLAASAIPSRMMHRALAESDERRGEAEAAMKALKESEQHFRDVFDSSSDAIFIQDSETGSILSLNQAALDMNGWTCKEFEAGLKTNFFRGFSGDTAQLSPEKLQQVMTGEPTVFEWVGRRKDGEEFPVEVVLKKSEIGGHLCVVARVRDISERKGALSSLKRRNELSHLIGDIATWFVGIQSSGFEKRVQEAIKGVGQFLGANEGLLLLYDRNQNRFHTRVEWTGEHAPASWRALRSISGAQRPWWSMQMKKNQVVAITDLRDIPPEGENEKRMMEQLGVQAFVDIPLFSGEGLSAVLSLFSVENEPRWKDEELAMLRFMGAILLGALERNRREAENELLQEQMRQSQKMDAVGKLAGGVAHDFNNMLGAILGSAEVLEEHVSERGKSFLSIIQRAANQAAGLTEQLLAFSRKGGADQQIVDLHTTIGDVVTLLDRSLDKRVHVVTRLEATTSKVLGDASQLQSILLNLGINAGQAMPLGGNLIFQTSDKKVTTEDYRFCPFDIKPGRYICIEVIDFGEGIPSELLSKIFDPFFTTKPQGQGTGLGLSMAYGAVRDHRGAILVESTVGLGSTFSVLLPLTDQVASDPQQQAELVGGQGLVMVVDDEEMVRVSMEAMLQRLGFEVVQSAGGQEALNLYDEMGEKIALVVLDMMMPEMTGREVFDQLRRRNPDVRCILASGFSQEEDLSDMLENGLRGHLRKPFPLRDLSAVVSQALA
jgi:PAS domain S-box-containing protein